MSPRQTSNEFRQQEQRTLIGFGIYFKDENNNIECLNIDLVSNNQGQTSYDSVNAFRLKRTRKFYIYSIDNLII